MDKEMRLKIVGVHSSGDEEEVVETDTRAQYFLKNGTHYFFYEETEENFPGKTKTRMKYRDGILEIVRRGSWESGLLFESQRVHRTMYHTPAGDMSLEVETKELDFCEKQDQICIFVKYKMRMNEGYETDCSIEIRAYEK